MFRPPPIPLFLKNLTWLYLSIQKAYSKNLSNIKEEEEEEKPLAILNNITTDFV
jgi:hypothetical protein